MILYILFIGHFLADFTLQSEKMVERKLNSFKYQIFHALIYAAIFSVAIFPFIEFTRAILAYIIIIFSHFIIDLIKICVCRKTDDRAIAFVSFIIDQVLHILILVITCLAIDLDARPTKLYDLLPGLPNFYYILVYCLAFIILWDPAAVFVKKLFELIDRNNNKQEESDSRVGRIIGKLERIVVSVFILNNQFGAIGFVLTAKSIARYKQLEDKGFAEKYLVGTLTSVLIAIIITVILKQQL